MKIYAGIGSRRTPPNVLALMRDIGFYAQQAGWLLRSGAAPGADSAFERGALDAIDSPNPGLYMPEIYLPWKRFNGHASHLHEISELALTIAAQHHPAWDKCSSAARKLHARNCYQVLGYFGDDPHLVRTADLVICWTPGGLGTGGTGQALRLAREYGVKIHDLAIPRIYDTYLRRCIRATGDTTG